MCVQCNGLSASYLALSFPCIHVPVDVMGNAKDRRGKEKGKGPDLPGSSRDPAGSAWNPCSGHAPALEFGCRAVKSAAGPSRKLFGWTECSRIYQGGDFTG